jgi:hypothetical protein
MQRYLSKKSSEAINGGKSSSLLSDKGKRLPSRFKDAGEVANGKGSSRS